MPMGLETLIEAARFVEYQAELKAAQAQATFTASVTINEPGPQQQLIRQPEGSGNNNNLINGTISWTNGNRAKNGNNDNYDMKRKQEKELHSRQVREQRAHLRGCMDGLRDVLPQVEQAFPCRMTTMMMLKTAVKVINQLEGEDKLYEEEKERLAEEKNRLELRFAAIQQEVGEGVPTMEPEIADAAATAVSAEAMDLDTGNFKLCTCDNLL